MRYEQTFADIQTGGTSGANTASTSTHPDGGANPRIVAALDELEQARIRPMSPRETEQTLGLLGRVRSVAASLMCDVAEMQAVTDTDPVEVLRQGARLPTRESKRIAKMGKQLAVMPKVKERFAAGDLTPNHVNALVNAAEKVGPETVDTDQDLLEAADRLPADSFGQHTRRWSERKLIEAGLDPLERQRKAREAKLWVEADTGLGVLMAKLPRPQFEQVRQAVDNHYLHHLRRDGANGEDPDTVRTPKQRVADVVYELLTNRNALSGEFITDQVGIKAKASTQLIIAANLGAVDGTHADGQVEIVGVGPVPPDILKTLTPDTELAGMIFDRAGRPLWLGRNQRLGNAAQRLAVAVRDGGCYECGAPMHRCELHHIKEWRRDHGPTDIDNLVAVCRQHHKWLETQNLQVRKTPNGYQTQPRAGPSPP